MAAKSDIEWTDASWTPVRALNLKTGKIGWHCEHSTTGCEFCYAEGLNKRLGTGLPFKPGHRSDIEIFLDDKMLLAPLKWKRPRMIFVCSMTDLFADFVPDEWIDKIFAVMALCPQHTFQVLTKRAGRMRDYCSDRFTSARIWMASERQAGIAGGRPRDQWPLPNVWLGVSTERQQEADERIPLLLQTPAAIRFVSAEPLLGPINLDGFLWGDWQDSRSQIRRSIQSRRQPSLDWIIVGGESGHDARPMHPDWARSLRDQCKAASVPFFFKQWGGWAPGECSQKPPNRSERIADWFNGKWDFSTITPRVSAETHIDDEPDVYRFGKKAAGRKLDGVEHNGMPGQST